MLEKFNSNSGKLEEILATGKRNLGKSGIRYVEKKGKTMKKSSKVFAKTTNSIDQGES